jgi:hypothetical protein
VSVERGREEIREEENRIDEGKRGGGGLYSASPLDCTDCNLSVPQ